MLEQSRAAEELKMRDKMIEEKKRKLELAEAEKEKRAAELRLSEAQKKIQRLSHSPHRNGVVALQQRPSAISR